jgi:hypothetical protein
MSPPSRLALLAASAATFCIMSVARATLADPPRAHPRPPHAARPSPPRPRYRARPLRGFVRLPIDAAGNDPPRCDDIGCRTPPGPGLIASFEHPSRSRWAEVRVYATDARAIGRPGADLRAWTRAVVRRFQPGLLDTRQPGPLEARAWRDAEGRRQIETHATTFEDDGVQRKLVRYVEWGTVLYRVQILAQVDTPAATLRRYSQAFVEAAFGAVPR